MAIYKRERSTRLLVIALVVSSLMIITLDFRGGERGPLATLGRVSLAVISPIQDGVARVFRPIGSFFSDVAKLGSLKAENLELRRQVAEFRGEQARIQELVAENEELRGLLKLKEPLAFETIGATVIAQSPSNFEAAVTINRGSADGLGLDMPVLAAQGLVGRVVRVTSSWAKVMLIIDSGSGVGARLAASRETGILRGQRERDLRLDLVDPETPVDPGEQIVTSGLGGVFPPGIPVGEVSRIVPNESTLEQELLVRPHVDFSRLSDVLVILSSEVLTAPQK
jgi:rod shape-determining protein MreC